VDITPGALAELYALIEQLARLGCRPAKLLFTATGSIYLR
jgi:hypothetical protein